MGAVDPPRRESTRTSSRFQRSHRAGAQMAQLEASREGRDSHECINGPLPWAQRPGGYRGWQWRSFAKALLLRIKEMKMRHRVLRLIGGRRRRLSLLLATGALVALGVFMITSAFAVHDLKFQLDGDTSITCGAVPNCSAQV